MTNGKIDSFVEQLIEFDSAYTPIHLLEICSNKEILRKTEDENHKKKDWALIQAFGTMEYFIFCNN